MDNMAKRTDDIYKKPINVLFRNSYFVASLFILYQVYLFHQYHKVLLNEASISSPSHVNRIRGGPLTNERRHPSINPKVDNETDSCGNRNTFHLHHIHNGSIPMYYPPPLPKDVVRKNTLGTFRVSQGPRYGSHRCDKDVVMAFAHGYQIKELIHFLTSLWRTEFDGDTVIGVGTNLHPETRTFLKNTAEERAGFVVYEIPLSCQRRNSCKLEKLVEEVDANGNIIAAVEDTRPHRRVSVLRYEYYWAWARRYNKKSLIFLTDARDVYFQRDPIQAFLKHQAKEEMPNQTSDYEGTLVFFEEALKVKDSRANSRWIKKTYSNDVLNALSEKMVICSGTSLGSQAAIETYTRAMVQEFDNTRCKHCANQHDQCFHNYLIHQNLLTGANDGQISNVIVHGQGQGGIVNTIGKVTEAREGKSLIELELINPETQEVLENDHKTVSAVVHMFDRHPLLEDWVSIQVENERKTLKLPTLESVQSNRTNH